MDTTPRGSGRRPSTEPVAESGVAAYSNLESLPERKSEYGFQGFAVNDPILANAIGATIATSHAQDTIPQTSHHATFAAPIEEVRSDLAPPGSTLPQVSRVASGFGTDFWGASGLTEDLHPTTVSQPTGSIVYSSQSAIEPRELQHQPSLGFRSIVHQAFDSPNDDASVPPTPISRDSSQRGSETSGISPILSRVPSEATADARAHALGVRDAAISPIAEESSQPASPSSRPISAAAPVEMQRSSLTKSSPVHSRNVSGESVPSSFVPGYRRNLDTPSPGNSPSRTPELEYTKRLSTGMTAEPRTSAKDDAHRNITAVKIPNADYTKRESDLADEVSSGPDKDFTEAARAVQVARSHFLQTHSPTLSSPPTFSNSGSRAASPMPGRESPGPGRVREIAGKYNELHNISRTNSGLSLDSRESQSSMASWERSDENLSLRRTGTVDSNDSDETNLPRSKGAISEQESLRPEANRGASFRPHLPGEWISYLETPATERPEDLMEVRPSTVLSGHADTGTRSPDTPRGAQQSYTDAPDFTSSSTKRIAQSKGLIDDVKAAGDALGAALLASVGMGHEAEDSRQPAESLGTSAEEHPTPVTSTSRYATGDVYLRPFALSQAPPSAGSSVAPTPPPKDYPKLDVERSSGYFPRPILRVDSDALSGQSAADSPYDMESDRLRREIERSLTPQVASETEEQVDKNETVRSAPNDMSSLQRARMMNVAELPADHTDAAKLDSDSVVPKSLNDAPRHVASDNRPALLDQRFSWEERPQASNELFGLADSETKPSASYERPLSTGALHVVNTNISTDSDFTSSVREAPSPDFTHGTRIVTSAVTKPLNVPSADPVIQTPVSPIMSPNVGPVESDINMAAEFPPSPLETSPRLAEVEGLREQPLPNVSVEDTRTNDFELAAGQVSNDSAPTTALRIPPFREILALKSSSERISSYNSTRNQFATMDTGLQNWLSSTISSHPQHSDIASGGALKLTNSNVIGSVRHRGGPSLLKIANKIGSSNRDTSNAVDTDAATATSGAERKTSVSQSSGTEKMQTKGKELLHSFGGKASGGAKGLFAKAKGRLREGGSEKVD